MSEPQLAVRIDRSIKIRAWTVHATQAKHLRRVYGLPPSLLYTFFDKEHYALAE